MFLYSYPSNNHKTEADLGDNVLFQGEDISDPLAIRLLNAIVNLLFYPNFTVAPLKKVPEQIDTFPPEQVWY